MKRILKKTVLALLALLLLAGIFPLHATNYTGNELKNEILLSELQKFDVADTQEWIDTLAMTAGDGNEWYVFALAATGVELDYSAYARALNDLTTQKNVANASTRQKYAMILLSCGYASDFVEATRNDSLGKLGVMSYIFGLHLATNGFAPNDITADEIIDTLLTLRRADGGFSVVGDTSDVDVTAMALQALAPYSDRSDVSHAIDEGLALLSAKQQESGGFYAYGVENPESASQVIVTLCALGIDPLKDERFIKNGNTALDAILRVRLENGGFSHVMGENENANATMQVFLAMTALDHFHKGGNSLYVLDHTDSLTYLESASEAPSTEEPGSYRLPVILVIVGLSLVICLVLFLCKKRSPKSFLTVGIVAIAAVLIVLFTDFQSADSYYNGASQTKANAIGSVTLSIRCDVLKDQDSPYIPKNGVILETTTFEIEDGDTVYDILAEAARSHKIQMETKGVDELVYVEGIAYLYELQFGDLSGWIFSVNGKTASVGCGTHTLSDGDVIEWHYTLNLGKDVSEVSPISES